MNFLLFIVCVLLFIVCVLLFIVCVLLFIVCVPSIGFCFSRPPANRYSFVRASWPASVYHAAGSPNAAPVTVHGYG